MCIKEAETIHKMDKPNPTMTVLVNVLQISSLPMAFFKESKSHLTRGRGWPGRLMLWRVCLYAPRPLAALGYDCFAIERARRSLVFHDFLGLPCCAILDPRGVGCSLLPPATEAPLSSTLWLGGTPLSPGTWRPAVQEHRLSASFCSLHLAVVEKSEKGLVLSLAFRMCPLTDIKTLFAVLNESRMAALYLSATVQTQPFGWCLSREGGCAVIIPCNL